jgi:hypothetical protein
MQSRSSQDPTNHPLAPTMSDPSIQIHPPNSNAAELSVAQFPLDKFLGSWHVVWSTLPLWKVSCRFTRSFRFC